MTANIKSLLDAKRAAHKNNNKTEEKKIQKEIKTHIEEAKIQYKDKMLTKMSSNMKQAWQAIKAMSNQTKPSSSNFDFMDAADQRKLADELNQFYTRFNDPELAAVPPDPEPPDKAPDGSEITVEEVRAQLRQCQPEKAAGPDGILTKILKSCYFELAPIFCKVFNLCLLEGKIPNLWKLSAISPLPKKSNPKSNNDYRPIALTSVIMKCFEKIIKEKLLKYVDLDNYQYAYKRGCSTKDACIGLDYFLRSHLDKPSTYARILFVDFTSAFNTIVPKILLDKLESLDVPFFLRSVIKSFLVDRQQFVRIAEQKSGILHCNIGCPQGCVLSPILFSIYTDFIRSTHPNVKIFKYADDMAIVGLLSFKDPDTSFPFFDAVQTFVDQCASVNLLINASKTKEMVVNFSRTYAIYDYIFISGNPIERVSSFKYLGTFFDDNLKWQSNTDYIYGKLRQRFYAFSRFKHFRPNKQQRDYFIQSLIKPILLYNFELWYNYATDKQKERLTKPFSQNNFDLDMDFYLESCVCKTAANFIADSSHVLHSCYQTNRKHYRAPKANTNRFLDSFVPFSIRALNS